MFSVLRAGPKNPKGPKRPKFSEADRACIQDEWQENKSLNVSSEINNETYQIVFSDVQKEFKWIVLPEEISGNPEVLMIVSSNRDNFARRNVIRKSWMNSEKNKIVAEKRMKILFLVGIDSNNEKENTVVLKEAQLFGDMIVVDLEDNYRNLPFKSLTIMLYGQSKTPESVKLIGKIDEDVIFYPDQLTPLINDGTINMSISAIYGNKRNAGVEVSNKNKRSKWFIPKSSFKCQLLPSYLFGSFYLTTRNAAEQIVKSTKHRKFITVEDALISGLLAGDVGVENKQLPFIHMWDKLTPNSEESPSIEGRRGSLVRPPPPPEAAKTDKNSSASDEKNTDSGGDGGEKKNSKEKENKKKSKILPVKGSGEEEGDGGKNSKSKEEDKEKEKEKSTKKKKDGSSKSRKMRLSLKKLKDKSKKSKKVVEKKKDEEEEEDNEKPPEPGSDPRKIWAFKAAKMKCQSICKLHQDKIKGYMPPNCTYTAYEANPDLNRYTDVRCIEETRVILKNHERDYIHASWMRMPGKDQTTYITTQGPLPETLTDFWHMIYQEKISYVLMLCTLFEGGVEKCVLYYPEKLGEVVKFGRYEITLTECKEEAIAGTIWNALTVVDTADPASEPLYMNHVQVPWWPDQLAPEDARPMIELYKWVKNVNPKGTPICVHCSAGVGRTATFVGIDYATLRIMENPNIEMVEIVREMRAMRFQAVQSHMQFLFLYVALMQYFIDDGVVELNGRIEAFMTQYKKHAQRKLAKRAVQNQQGEKAAAEEKEKGGAIKA
ncbi:hypothetical protein B9Z55_011679 [Caenorhabditis nigoni]|uniref:Protein-tyrosine-phosphatase n=1 Tax=Caenorhabditis nigoni TaxID=1611254 RepID=A0A2G5UL55_9PELO|nr:hypothetical protein B9Z55_011679 [Caenorhabditis nigoni]